MICNLQTQLKQTTDAMELVGRFPIPYGANSGVSTNSYFKMNLYF